MRRFTESCGAERERSQIKGYHNEPWRRQQNVEMAQVLKAAGARRVEVVQIADRSHMSILRKLPEEGDPAAARVVEFIRAVAKD